MTGDIAVPLDRWVSQVARLPRAEELAHVARMTPGGLSNKDLRAFTPEQIQEDLARYYAESAEDSERTSGSEGEVYDSFYGDLLPHYGQEGAARVAATMQAFYRTMGARIGVDAKTLFDRFRINIGGKRRGSPGAAPRDVDTGIDPLIDAAINDRSFTDDEIHGGAMGIIRAIVLSGGIRPDSVGADDLRSLGNLPPGFFNANGRTAENMAETLADSGFRGSFTDVDSYGRPGSNELSELVRRELFGDKVRPDMDEADQDRAVKRATFNEDVGTVKEAFKEYEAATGVDPSTLPREQQREIALGGLNALDQGALLERTWEQLADLYMQIDKDAFRYKFSQSKELGDILNDMLPGAQAGDWMDAPAALRNKGIQAVLHVQMKDGRRARLDLHPGNRISLDASNLKSGESYGGALYQAIADYALKNDLVFMGDPQGLSDIAVHRRTEQMLSAALRAKTTRHLAPHPRQGVRWEVGNDRANIAALLEKSHENVAEIVPEIADWRYNFSHGRFESVAEKSNAKWGAWVRRASRSEGAREAGIGRTTLERAVLAQSLLQGEGRTAGAGVVAPHAQRGDSERLNPLAGALHGTGLEGILYQDNPAAGGVSASGDSLSQGGKSPRGQIVGRDGQSIIGQKAENGSREFNITLFEGKDLSTVLHEAGHAFFEIFGDLAEDANASEQLKADYAALLAWAKVKDRSEVGRAQHEQFARGFEAYAREGKAPSPALRRAFAMFGTFLTRIYKVLSALNVNLTPEVRAVFDRNNGVRNN